ncbi:MAG: hypothetical protein EZS28_031271 [Streblomastix strix]|uniref:Uncharacterized protein n=1 Tax=Streblomastix strix TaxID=222440 RepID=A0A5J4USY9_9EUKA|nr:MAG: hypothetical protein EZS28_031271 [Streblomastix strix]
MIQKVTQLRVKGRAKDKPITGQETTSSLLNDQRKLREKQQQLLLERLKSLKEQKELQMQQQIQQLSQTDQDFFEIELNTHQQQQQQSQQDTLDEEDQDDQELEKQNSPSPIVIRNRIISLLSQIPSESALFQNSPVTSPISRVNSKFQLEDLIFRMTDREEIKQQKSNKDLGDQIGISGAFTSSHLITMNSSENNAFLKELLQFERGNDDDDDDVNNNNESQLLSQLDHLNSESTLNSQMSENEKKQKKNKIELQILSNKYQKSPLPSPQGMVTQQDSALSNDEFNDILEWIDKQEKLTKREGLMKLKINSFRY